MMIETGSDGMFVGELADASGIGVETVRFYALLGIMDDADAGRTEVRRAQRFLAGIG